MARHLPQLPPTLSPGDRVAVLSPSWCAPEHHPELHEQAMRRIRDLLDLEPVEYPTTRRQGTPRERARDLMAAFGDPTVRAVFATIGGEDQITVMPHLDADVVRADPKPFFGYSDNTNLLNWLWSHGVAAFHGGSTQVMLGPGPAVDEIHLAGLRAALFGGGDLEITPLPGSRDLGIPWTDPRSLTDPAPNDPTPEGWSWHGRADPVRGPTWGGNLEVLTWILAAGHHVLEPAAYDGCVLLVETSEELPTAEEVFRMLRGLGERGILGRVGAVVVGRPEAANLEVRPVPEERARFRADQAEAVLRGIDAYAAGVPVVVGVEFGHTIPQWVLPYGGEVTVDGAARRLVAHFGDPRPRPG